MRRSRRRLDAVVAWRTEALGQIVIVMLRVFTGYRGDFSRQQAHDDTVFVRRPRFAVEAQERGPGALFAAEAQAAVEQAVHEPLEADRHFHQLAAQVGHHAVDHCAGHQRFTYRHIGAPLWAMLEQVVDGYRQIMVRVHQALRRDDAMAVVIRIVGKRQIEFVAQPARPAIADSDEQSMRMMPSWSRCIKRKV